MRETTFRGFTSPSTSLWFISGSTDTQARCLEFSFSWPFQRQAIGSAERWFATSMTGCPFRRIAICFAGLRDCTTSGEKAEAAFDSRIVAADSMRRPTSARTPRWWAMWARAEKEYPRAARGG